MKATSWLSSLSVLHLPTGLFATGAYADRKLGGNNITSFNGGNPNGNPASYTGPDVTMLWIAAGVSKNFFGIGNTVLFGEYGEHRGGLAQNTFLGGNAQGGAAAGFATCINGAPTNNPVTGGAATSCNSKVTQWGVALVQYIDAAAMEIYVGYKNYSLSTEGFIGTNTSLNKSQGGVNDISAVMAGTKINF